jgi:signal transduction histidine kinase
MLDEARLDSRIFVVDDEPANVELLEMSLLRAGYRHVLGTTDPRTVTASLESFQPDLILLDLLMPHLDGFAVMEQLGQLIPAEEYLPILVLTADITAEAKRRALSVGAHDFLTKPFDQVELQLRITNLLRTRLLYLQARGQYELMERLYHETQQVAQQREQAQLVLSHDLGQPVAALQVATRLLRHEATAAGEAVPSGLLERMALVEASTSRVLAMTGELLDLARLQRGQELDLHCRQVDLVPMVRLEVETHLASCETCAIRFDTAQPAIVGDVDAPRLARVIANLIGNAVKYSPEGGEIEVRLAEEGEGEQRRAVLEVQDHGLGIPAAELARIGEQFYRASNVARRIQGTGVGVLSARRIVQAHGGSLQIESEEGTGTCVTVSLPLG